MHLQASLLVLGLSAAPLALAQYLEVTLDNEDQSKCVIYADGLDGCNNAYSDSFGSPDEDYKCSIDTTSVPICSSAGISLGGEDDPIAFYNENNVKMECTVPSFTTGEGCTPTEAGMPTESPE